MDITIIIQEVQQLRDEIKILKKELLEMKSLLNEFYGSESYDGIDIAKCKMHIEVESWLNEHLEYCRNSILHSKDLYSLIFPSQNVSNIQKNHITKIINEWIVKNFPDVKSTFKNSRYNNVKYRGWKHFRIK